MFFNAVFPSDDHMAVNGFNGFIINERAGKSNGICNEKNVIYNEKSFWQNVAARAEKLLTFLFAFAIINNSDRMLRRCGGIGRRKGLKIPRSKERTGSSPVSGTKIGFVSLQALLFIFKTFLL